MEPIVLKNEVIQDEAILKKCKEALNKLSNTVEMFPVANLGKKSKFISASTYYTYRLKTSIDYVQRKIEWRKTRRGTLRGNQEVSKGDMWDINPNDLRRDFELHIEDSGRTRACASCNGTGSAGCHKCNGSGQDKEQCNVCKGYGKISEKVEVECPGEFLLTHRTEFRNGTHIVLDSFGKYTGVCKKCNGSGRVTETVHKPCVACNGHGSIPVTCNLCHGSGKVQCRECDGTGERCSTAYLIQEYFEGNEAFSSFNVSTTDVQDENGKNVVFSKFKFKEDEVLFDLTFDGHEAAFNELPIVQSEKDNVFRDAYDKLCQKIGIGNNVKVLQQRVWLAKCFRAIEYKYECDGQEYVCYINPNTWEVVEAPGKDLISHYAAKYQQLGELADKKGNWIGAFQNYIQAFGMQCAIHRSTDFKMGETYLKALDRTRKKTLIASLLFLIIGYLAGVALFYFSPDKDLLIINDWGEITVVNLIIWILNGIISFIFARKFFVNGNGIRIAGGKLVLFIIGILHGFAWAPRDYVSGNFFGGDKQLLICFIEIILYPVLMLLPIVFTGFALTQKQSSLAERTKKVKESFDKALKSGTIAKLAKSYRTSYFLTIYMLFAGIFCIAFLTLLSQPFTSPKDRLHNVTEILEKQGSQSERFKTFEVMLDRDLNKLLEAKYAPVYVVYATALANGCQYVDKDPQKALEILKQGCELNDEPSKKMMLELTAQRDTSDKVKALEEEIQTALAAGGEANYQKALELAAQMEPLDTKAAGKWRNKAKETKLTKTAQDAANAKDWAKAREDATEAFALNADNAVAAEIMATAEANLPVTDGMLYLSGVPLKMIKVHAGSFLMGSPNDELGRRDPSSFFKGTIWEDPEKQHRVTLTQDYWLGETEVTQEQWKAVMENNRSRNKGNQNPVENVSRSDAMDFCNKLNEKYSGKLPAGYKFSLPSEAQWEYACRAGTTTSLNSGKNITTIEKGAACSNLDEVGWYCQNTDSTQPVGKKKPNAWGFYDMHGNVNEWCSDLKKSGSNVYAINRGGSYKSSPLYCRSASYDIGGPDTREEYDGFYGFRLALVPIQ